jgi:hypothetical protein
MSDLLKVPEMTPSALNELRDKDFKEFAAVAGEDVLVQVARSIELPTAQATATLSMVDAPPPAGMDIKQYAATLTKTYNEAGSTLAGLKNPAIKKWLAAAAKYMRVWSQDESGAQLLWCFIADT